MADIIPISRQVADTLGIDLRHADLLDRTPAERKAAKDDGCWLWQPFEPAGQGGGHDGRY